jgi:hypothetical protein
MIEELLQLFVREVDAKLIETVFVEDFETSDVQHSGEGSSGLLGVEGVVTLLNEELEQPVEHGLGHGTASGVALTDVLALRHEFSSDLDPGLADIVVQPFGVDTEKLGSVNTFL